MREKKGRYGRSLLLMTLFLGLSFGIFFNMATTADATPSLSPDGKTCTPCHEPGGPGGAAGGGGAETGKPAEQPQTPVEPPAPVEQTPEAKPPEKESASPVLVIGLVAVVLGVIYVAAIRKKH